MTIKLEDLIYPPVSGFWGKEKQLTSKDILCKVVRNGDVQKNGTIYLDELPERSFLPIEYEKASLLPDDIVLVSSGAYTGNAGRLNHALITDKIIISNFVRRIRAKERVDPEWLFQLIRSDIVQSQVWNYVAGSAMPNLSSDLYKKCNIRYVPETYIQRKIGAILAEIDQAIEKTEALIDKYEQIKAGLMHDLFTRGINSDGTLRPTYGEAPELYQQTPIGWIPKNWDISLFGRKVEVIDPNPSHRYPLEVIDGYPICSTENFEGEDNYNFEKAKHVPEITYVNQNNRCQFESTDVIFARKGKIGLARRYGKNKKAFSHTVVIMKPSSELVDSNWLLWLSRSSWLLKAIETRMNTNSGVPTLGVEFIKNITVPFPGNEEQKIMNYLLEAASGKIQAEFAKKEKLMRQKYGLMQDLLTGKVQVPINSPETDHV